jgi:hypothetical protein
MAGEIEWLPWYRRKEYRGNLTEKEKRHLDSFRRGNKHPATALEDLPDEVQAYLGELELAVHDKTQEKIIIKAFALTAIGAFLIVSAYRNTGWASPLLEYFLGGSIIVFAWFGFSRKWKSNTEDLWINNKGNGAPFSRTEEKLQKHWELNEINRFRKLYKEETDGDLL